MTVVFDSKNNHGYTLMEVLLTMIIMGMILLIVNVVMIAIIRTSYTTDTRIKMRQNMEFSVEVFRRTAKSSESVTIIPNPSTTVGCGVDFDDAAYPFHEATQLMLEGGLDSVIFYVDQAPSPSPISNCKPVLKAMWNIGGNSHVVNLTSPSEVALQPDPTSRCGISANSGFDVSLTVDTRTRLTNIIMTLTADSAQEKSAGVPVVGCVVKQVSILRQPREL